jgi:ABC-type thiamine transport system ATPase subunit
MTYLLRSSLGTYWRLSEKAGNLHKFSTGKSTILNLLAKLFTPDSGKILIDGKDLTTMDQDWI